MIKFLKWFAGFFEDQKGSASSKRAFLYFLAVEWHYVVNAYCNLKGVDNYFLYALTLITLVCLGVITTEFFKDPKNILK